MHPDEIKTAITFSLTEKQHDELMRLVASHPSFATPEEYLVFLVDIAIRREDAIAGEDEAHDLTQQLTALGYL